MDFPFPLNKSQKPHSSLQNWKKISAALRAVSGSTESSTHEEEKFNLLSHRAEGEEPEISMRSGDHPDRRDEILLKIDGGNTAGDGDGDRDPPPSADSSGISSDGFWKSGGNRGGGRSESFDFRNQEEDPPSKLIGEFLHKQRASGDFSLDMDLEMNELHRRSTLPPAKPMPRASYEARRRSKDTPSPDQNPTSGEVLSCTSNSSFKNSPSLNRKSGLLITKTKSRLMDPPEQPDLKSGRVAKSGPVRSGYLGRVADEDEDDLSLGEDIPDEYKKEKLSFWVLLQWVSLILLIATLICTISIKKLRKIQKLDFPLWKWEVLVLVLICGRLVSGRVIRIMVFFIERNFLLRKRVLYFVYGIKNAVQNCLWLGLVLIAWHLLFDKDVEEETNQKALQYVSKVLVCFLVGVMLWLVKTLVIKVLASSFHVSTYFDRIQDSLFNQYVIETLSGPPLVEIKRNEEEAHKLQNDQKSAKLCGDDGITIDHLHKLNPSNVSAWNMKRLMRIVRHGALSTMDERILGTSHEDESATQIRSENEAKAAARKIFYNVAEPGSKCIFLEDLVRFLQDDEASKTMSLFEGAPETKKITKSALRNWVVNAFRERRALALSLNDTKTAVNKLHQMVNVLIGIIILVISLLILGIASTKSLVFISSQLLLVAFIFGNTCKTVFEAIIFLFVMHPFDVGDRCEIEGVQMVVEEMNILSTVFLRFDNQKIVYPNSVLATKAISNYYRSPDMGDAVEFCVHISTPAEKIAAIKQRITSYVDNKKEHWYSTPMIIFKDVEGLSKVRMAVWVTHRMNHQDMGEKWTRRGYLVEEMVKMFKDLDIHFRLLPLDVNVCAMPLPTSSRQPANWTAVPAS